MKHCTRLTYCLSIYNTRSRLVSWRHCYTLASLLFAFSLARKEFKNTSYRFSVDIHFGSAFVSMDFSRKIRNISVSRFKEIASLLRLTALNQF